MVNRLRNQIAQWEMMGLVVPDDLRDEVLEATRDFSRAATTQDEPEPPPSGPSARSPRPSTRWTARPPSYAEQAIEMRRAQSKKLDHLVRRAPGRPDAAGRTSRGNCCRRSTWCRCRSRGGRSKPAKVAAIGSEADAQVEWAQTAGLRIMGGPLLELDDRGVPDWTYLWEGDFDSLLGFMLDHVRDGRRSAIAARSTSGKSPSRMTHGHVLGAQRRASGCRSRPRRSPRSASSIRRRRSSSSFDQPWAEYLASEQLDLAPLHFADALVRADLGLSGLGLEINVGYHPGGSPHRGPLAFSRLIDTWSLLELPLLVALTLPSSADEGPAWPTAKIQVLSSEADEVTPESQRDWIERHVPLLLAKNAGAGGSLEPALRRRAASLSARRPVRRRGQAEAGARGAAKDPPAAA